MATGDAPLQSLLARVPPERLLIVSDFDGTLASIVQNPADARPLEGAVEALEGLRDAVLRVAILTGRSAAALRRILPVEGVLVLGDYGRPDPTEAERRALRAFNQKVVAVLARRPGIRVEEKPGSTSVHYRDRPSAGEGLLEEVRPLAAAAGLEVRSGRMVVEVLPAGWDKARALERLMTEERASGVVYSGDDEGDRGCFELLARSPLPHLAVGVRSPEAAPDLFALCDLVVEGPEALVELLRGLAEATRRGRGRGRAGRGPGGSASG